MPVEIRDLTADDPAAIAHAFAAVGWPGKTVEQYHRYVQEQMDGTRTVLERVSKSATVGVGPVKSRRVVDR